MKPEKSSEQLPVKRKNFWEDLLAFSKSASMAIVLLIIAAIFGVILLLSTLLTDRKAKPFEGHGPR